MVLTVSFVLFLVTGLCCHHRPCDAARIITSLNASVGASEPHDFAVRYRRVSSCAPKRPSHPAPNVRDDRETPLISRRDGEVMLVIWGRDQLRHIGTTGKSVGKRSAPAIHSSH